MEEYEKTIQNIESQVKENHKKIQELDEKRRMSRVNQLESKIEIASPFALFGYMGLTLLGVLTPIIPSP